MLTKSWNGCSCLSRDSPFIPAAPAIVSNTHCTSTSNIMRSIGRARQRTTKRIMNANLAFHNKGHGWCADRRVCVKYPRSGSMLIDYLDDRITGLCDLHMGPVSTQRGEERERIKYVFNPGLQCNQSVVSWEAATQRSVIGFWTSVRRVHVSSKAGAAWSLMKVPRPRSTDPTSSRLSRLNIFVSYIL